MAEETRRRRSQPVLEYWVQKTRVHGRSGAENRNVPYVLYYIQNVHRMESSPSIPVATGKDSGPPISTTLAANLPQNPLLRAGLGRGELLPVDKRF
jgi:hypothetical protein